jgi:hypothetical protein
MKKHTTNAEKKKGGTPHPPTHLEPFLFLRLPSTKRKKNPDEGSIKHPKHHPIRPKQSPPPQHHHQKKKKKKKNQTIKHTKYPAHEKRR